MQDAAGPAGRRACTDVSEDSVSLRGFLTRWGLKERRETFLYRDQNTTFELRAELRYHGLNGAVKHLRVGLVGPDADVNTPLRSAPLRSVPPAFLWQTVPPAVVSCACLFASYCRSNRHVCIEQSVSSR